MGNRLRPRMLFQQLLMFALVTSTGLCCAACQQPSAAADGPPNSLPEWVKRHSFMDGIATVLAAQTGPPRYELAESDSQSSRNMTRHRLFSAAICGAALLGILGILFGYMRINHATRGFYNRRLQTLSIMTAVALMIAIYFVYKSLM